MKVQVWSSGAGEAEGQNRVSGMSVYTSPCTCWSPPCEQQGTISPHIKGIHGGTGVQMPEEGIE